jgi:hypothetical protein
MTPGKPTWAVGRWAGAGDHLVHRVAHQVAARPVVADVQLAVAALRVVVVGVSAADHVGVRPAQLGEMTEVHPEHEGVGVARLPAEPVDLVKPGHDVAPPLGPVLGGRHPVEGPRGGDVLPDGVPVWAAVTSRRAALPTLRRWSWPGMHCSAHRWLIAASSSSHT